MASVNFLIGIHGTTVDDPEVKKKIEDAIEKALMPLQGDGVYLERMIIATGTEEEIGATVRRIRGE